MIYVHPTVCLPYIYHYTPTAERCRTVFFHSATYMLHLPEIYLPRRRYISSVTCHISFSYWSKVGSPISPHPIGQECTVANWARLEPIWLSKTRSILKIVTIIDQIIFLELIHWNMKCFLGENSFETSWDNRWRYVKKCTKNRRKNNPWTSQLRHILTLIDSNPATPQPCNSSTLELLCPATPQPCNS